VDTGDAAGCLLRGWETTISLQTDKGGTLQPPAAAIAPQTGPSSSQRLLAVSPEGDAKHHRLRAVCIPFQSRRWRLGVLLHASFSFSHRCFIPIKFQPVQPRGSWGPCVSPQRSGRCTEQICHRITQGLRQCCSICVHESSSPCCKMCRRANPLAGKTPGVSISATHRNASH